MTTTLILDDRAAVGRWVAEQVEQTASWGDFYAMGISRDGELLGGIVFNNFNGSNCTVHIALTRYSKGVIPLFEAAADYAFNQCKLKRLTGLVTSSNTKALALDKHLGFEEEFVMKHAGVDDDDLHVLVMWPHKCRWFRPRGEV